MSESGVVVRCLITTLILLFLALSAGSLMAWLILRPKAPNFKIKTLNTSNSTVMAAECDVVVFSAENPNRKISFQFNSLNVFIEYKSSGLSRGHVSVFEVRRMGEATKRVEMKKNTRDREMVVEGLTMRKEMVVDVRMEGRVGVQAGKWGWGKTVEVKCRNLRFRVYGNDRWKLVKDQHCSSHWA